MIAFHYIVMQILYLETTKVIIMLDIVSINVPVIVLYV